MFESYYKIDLLAADLGSGRISLTDDVKANYLYEGYD